MKQPDPKPPIMGRAAGSPAAASTDFGPTKLPPGIRSRRVFGINGLSMHVLEAGFETQKRPCVLLLHGFPELAYSWRKIMPPLAAAGFHVVAPDQRGYGRTTGWDGDYDGELDSFRMTNLVRDAFGLVAALGYRSVAAVVGHDFGSPVAAWCAVMRPDVFRAVVLMSAPFAGPPEVPFDTAGTAPLDQPAGSVRNSLYLDDALAALDRPRKHYQLYYTTREADGDMRECPQGMHDFLRAYYHFKSADWTRNKPFRLASFSAEELARMPTYYVMDRARNMAETVASEMPTAAEIAACEWLPDSELSVYVRAFARTGLQGGLNWYRCQGGKYTTELEIHSGRSIDVPSLFIAGASDWGVYQRPGAFERMQDTACTRMRGAHLLHGAGHWVQQEQPEQVSRLLQDFLRGTVQA